MPPVMPGFDTTKVIGIANTPEELNHLAVQEASLPDFSRVLIEIPVAPGQNIYEIAQQVESACASAGMLTWPERPAVYTFIEGDILYVAYMKAPPTSPTPQLFGIILVIGAILIIGPVIMYLVSPGFRDFMNNMIVILVLFAMMKVMQPIISPPPKEPAAPKLPKPPLEERIHKHLDNLGYRIGRIDELITVSIPDTQSKITDLSSHISNLAREVKAAPDTVMAGHQKAETARRMAAHHKKLAEYEKHLTSSQREKLQRERKLVQEILELFPEE